MDLPTQDQGLPTPIPPIPADKPSFFKRRIFKFLILPIVLIILLLVIADVATGGEVRFFGKLAYTYFEERNSTSTPTLVSSSTAISEFSLQHQTPLTALGIATSSQQGNGADDYLNYFGYDTPAPVFHHVSGTWDNVYGGLDERKINLGAQDEQFLITVASKQNFSFFPDHFPIPKTPISDAPLPFNPASILRFTRRMIVLADTYSSSSNPGRAELLLQSLLTWGRKMEDAKDTSMIEWLVGEKIEETTAPALISFYNDQGNVNQKNALLAYQQEIASIKANADKFNSFDYNFTTTNVALSALKDPQINDPVSVNAVIKSFMAEDDYSFMLNAFNTDDPVIQSAALHGGLMILRIRGPAMQHSIAMQILQRYQQSASPVVQTWANYALNTDPQQIVQDTQAAASSSPF